MTNSFFDLPQIFGRDATNDALKTWTDFNARFSGIAVDAAQRSNEIATESARQTFSRLHDVTRVRDEPAEYAQVFGQFAQAQTELTRRTAEAFGDVMARAQSDASDLFARTGERGLEQGTATTKTAARKTASRAKKAA